MQKNSEQIILKMLQSGAKTTIEIIDAAKLEGFECNEKSMEFLPILEKKGIVRKKFDIKRKEFLWDLGSADLHP